MNIDLLIQKEKLFAEYRDKIQELESTQQKAHDLTHMLDTCNTQIYKLENEITSIRKLIDYMIRFDLDPVEAKLKYQDAIETGENKSIMIGNSAYALPVYGHPYSTASSASINNAAVAKMLNSKNSTP